MLGFVRFFIIWSAIFIDVSASNSSDLLPIIPDEMGYGIYTEAGRGGEIYRISNLHDSGEGSFRECVEGKKPRICIFEVSGYIDLKDVLVVRHPYITIAGQTAPSPGVTIRGAGLNIKSHDVFVQHIRIRVGDILGKVKPIHHDGLEISSRNNETVSNIVIDHVSVSWAIDENMSLWASDTGRIENVSILNSIISEGLNNSHHPKGPHSKGLLVGRNSNGVLIKNTLFARNYARNPLVRDNVNDIVIANNYICFPGDDWFGTKIYLGSRGEKNSPMNVSILGNTILYAETDLFKTIIYGHEKIPPNSILYLNRNQVVDDAASAVLVMRRKDMRVVYRLPNAFPKWVAAIQVFSPKQLSGWMNDNVGARPWDRDLVDKRAIQCMSSKEYFFVDSQNDVGGWPVLAENYRALDVPQNLHDDDDGNGYSNVEDWLQQEFH